MNAYGDVHMKKLSSFVLGAGLAIASIGMAHADSTVGGTWKLSVGVNDAPCTLTLTPDASSTEGTIASGADCPAGLYAVSTWKVAGNGIELYNGGELVAFLKPKGDNFVGKRFADGRQVALSR